MRGISHLGGTIIGSTNTGDPIAYPVQQDDGTWTEVDRSDELIGRLADAGIDASFPRSPGVVGARRAFLGPECQGS